MSETTATRTLSINDKFRDLLPVLGDDERALLKEQIEETGGPVEPIAVWAGHDVIVDGHNRYSICEETDLPFEVREIEFDDEQDVIEWMIRHQLGRRNLTKGEYQMFLGTLYENRKGKPTEDGKTVAQSVAEDVGVNEKTVRRAGKFAKGVEAIKKVDAAEADAVLKGKSKLSKGDVEKIGDAAAKGKSATKEQVAAAKKTATAAKAANKKPKTPAKADTSAPKAPKITMPTGEYQVIVATPYEDVIEGMGKFKLPSAADAVLFLRIDKEWMPEAFDACKKWGFTVVDQIIQAQKTTSSKGNWSRTKHTNILVATKGEPMMPAPTDRPASIVETEASAGIAPTLLASLDKATKGLNGKLLMFSSAEVPNFESWDVPSVEEQTEVAPKKAAVTKAPPKKAPPKKVPAKAA